MADDWQKRDGYRPKSAPHLGIDAQIIRIASRQKQLIRIEQLERLGLTRRGVAHRAAAGHLFRLHSGVYATHPPRT